MPVVLWKILLQLDANVCWKLGHTKIEPVMHDCKWTSLSPSQFCIPLLFESPKCCFMNINTAFYEIVKSMENTSGRMKKVMGEFIVRASLILKALKSDYQLDGLTITLVRSASIWRRWLQKTGCFWRKEYCLIHCMKTDKLKVLFRTELLGHDSSHILVLSLKSLTAFDGGAGVFYEVISKHMYINLFVIQSWEHFPLIYLLWPSQKLLKKDTVCFALDFVSPRWHPSKLFMWLMMTFTDVVDFTGLSEVAGKM